MTDDHTQRTEAMSAKMASVSFQPERDFELMLVRFCWRLRHSDDPATRKLVAQGMDLLKRKGTGSILRDEEPST